MGRTSNRAKLKWNAEHYAQVKVSVDPGLASRFKEACAAGNVSMASAISRFMGDYCDAAAPHAAAPDYASRRRRRAAVGLLVRQLLLIRDAEEGYASNIPENLQGSSVYDRAEQTISVLDEVIELLGSAY